MTNKLLIILGPTATGKTDIALDLAKKFSGELISCDSRQVYKYLDIGTGKLPSSDTKIIKGDRFWEINGIKVWLYDVIDPKKQYTVAHFSKDANIIIEEIIKRGKLPIIVGGTGLYLKALTSGLSNLIIPFDKKLRKELENLSLENLQQKLQSLSKTKWEQLNYSDSQNPRRLIRAIELLTLKPKTKNKVKEYDFLKIGLTAPREILYKRVDERIKSRIEQGMIEEAKDIKNKGVSLKRMRELGLEYGVLADYLEGNIQEENLIKILQGKIHAYVRRQLTWFKKEENVKWFDITDTKNINKLDNLVSIWYDSEDAKKS